MAILTLEQLKKKHPNQTARSVFTLSEIQRRAGVEAQIKGNQFSLTPESTGVEKIGTTRKIANFIGGEALARGLGFGLAAPSVQKGLTEAEQMLSDTAVSLIKQIRKAKGEGRDITRLENALADLKGGQQVARDVQEDFVFALPSSKEVVGSALRLGTTLSAGAIGRLGLKATAFGKATTFASGVLRGAGAGAISGASAGGLFGVSEGLQRDKDVKGVAVSGLLGAGLGAVIGAPLGAITGGLTGFLRGKAISKETFAEDLVSPKQTTKEKVQAIRQGRLEDPTFFKKAELQFSAKDKRLADAVRDVVSPKASLGENIDALRLQVNQTNNGVKGYIQTHKVPFNTNQLKSQLNSAADDLELVFASDTTAENTYRKVVDAFIKNVGQKDTSGLFEGRQTFDQLPAIQKLLNTQGLGENAKKEIVLTVRRAANDYIASLLPKGNIYKEAMLNEHYMLEALGNIAEKNANIIGKNNIQILSEQYPMLKWIVGGVLGGASAALGFGLGRGVGAGGSIIGSTD